MNLIDNKVTHKSFGVGTIVEHSDSYIKIHFSSGDKRFIFPDAFESYLTLKNKASRDFVEKMIEKKEKEQNKIDMELERKKALKLKEKQRILQIEKHLKNLKIHPSSQAAFSCKPQDINNIFEDWKVSVGAIKKGKNAGQPNKPIRLNLNSACLLTSRDADMSEKDRCIIGVYMAKEDFIGKLCKDGLVPAHSKYRLRLSKEESEKILFWNYYINEKFPNNMTWNSDKFRYFENIFMAQILRDILSMRKDSDDFELAQNFFEYFCEMNHIDENEIPDPNGVLIRSKV
jgi:hypothetical protein